MMIDYYSKLTRPEKEEIRKTYKQMFNALVSVEKAIIQAELTIPIECLRLVRSAIYAGTRKSIAETRVHEALEGPSS